jgi:hypothetical protein
MEDRAQYVDRLKVNKLVMPQMPLARAAHMPDALSHCLFTSFHPSKVIVFT